MRDLGGDTGQGVRFASACAVLFDQGAQGWCAVEGGAADSGASGYLVEGDGLPAEDEFGAGVFDVAVPVVVGGHPVCAWRM
jgi:hypothetical protein